MVVVGLVLALAISVLLVALPRSLQQPSVGTLLLLDCRGREIADIASPEARSQRPLKLEQMGKWLPRIAVALEDHRFYDHAAVDWRATAAATARNVRSRRIISGGSTITQQLAKLSTGRQSRSWLRKAYETVVAWKLERRWSKRQILAEYLNRSSYGNRRLGPESAARAYFGKPANDLTLAESIYLAGLPQAPTRLNPWTHPAAAAKKYQRSLNATGATGDHHARRPGVAGKIAAHRSPIRPAKIGAEFRGRRDRATPDASRYGPHDSRCRSSGQGGATASLACGGHESARHYPGRAGHRR